MAAAVLAEPYLKCGQELRAAAVAADDRCRVQHGVPTHLPSEPICPRGAVRGAVRWCSAGAARHALDGRRTHVGRGKAEASTVAAAPAVKQTLPQEHAPFRRLHPTPPPALRAVVAHYSPPS
eukprot:scaffold11396_cov66-Phaeocystis_antarctica.AAC.5